MALDAGLFLAAFRLATAKTVPTRDLWPGAILSAIAWQILLAFAGLVIKRYLNHATAVAGTFGIMLGLLAWFGLQATVTVYVIEADAVRAPRLWPRSITQEPLTDADRRFLDAATEAEARRPDQRVEIDYSPRQKPTRSMKDRVSRLNPAPGTTHGRTRADRARNI
jgi:hypothetical protein